MPPSYPTARVNSTVDAADATQFKNKSHRLLSVIESRPLIPSQEELARLAGLRQETVCRIESGKHSPTVRTVAKINKALQAALQKSAKAAKAKKGR
jgi:DNA-binding XRE family transcriptional regulator